MNLESLVRSKNLVVCVGSGGVGKTTSAAAIALQAAMLGRRTLVVTIDPARRLADAMGMKAFGNQVIRVESKLLEGKGELWALMLDTRSTFNEVIEKVSPDEETRNRILHNKIYQTISDSFSSNQDYMAVEKLYDLNESRAFDLIVLDTPPVKNALDFIEAPGRLARFLDQRIMKWFLKPYDEKRIFGKVMVGTSGVVFRLLAVVFGREFLVELSVFLLAFRELYDGFRERQESVLQLLADDSTTFLVICAPNEASTEVALFFHEELASRKLPVGGTLVNQVHSCSDRDLSAGELLGDLAADLSADLPDYTAASLIARLDMAHKRLRSVYRQEQEVMKKLSAMVGGNGFELRVLRLDEPVKDLDGLRLMGEQFIPAPARSIGKC